jgi:hypothetical protein
VSVLWRLVSSEWNETEIISLEMIFRKKNKKLLSHELQISFFPLIYFVAFFFFPAVLTISALLLFFKLFNNSVLRQGDKNNLGFLSHIPKITLAIPSGYLESTEWLLLS